MQKHVPVISILIVIVFAVLAVSAQAPQGGQAQGRGQAAARAKPGVDAATAKRMVAAAGEWQITIGQGGLPIVKDGKVIAAMGCGGSAPASDEKFCQAGINAMGK